MKNKAGEEDAGPGDVSSGIPYDASKAFDPGTENPFSAQRPPDATS